MYIIDERSIITSFNLTIFLVTNDYKEKHYKLNYIFKIIIINM